MEAVLLVIRLLLSLVFTLAGVTKLVDRAGARQAMLGFGIPANLAAPLAAVLPFLELVVAVTLIFATSAWWGALGALALLLAFTVVMGYQLARGRTPECHCFGEISTQPIGRSTLFRNLFLSGLAGILINVGPTQTDVSMTSGWLGSTADVHRLAQYFDVMTMSLLALGSVALIIWRQQGQLAQRLRELEADLRADKAAATEQTTAQVPAGVPAPRFRLPDVAGNTVTLDDLISASRRLVLIFSDPDCEACNALLPEISRWQRDHANMLTVALISRGTAETNRVKADQNRTALVLLQRDREVAEAYQVHGTPCAILVNTDQTITAPVACGKNQIRKLIEQAVSSPTPRSLPVVSGRKGIEYSQPTTNHVEEAPLAITPPIRAAAPTFRLPDLDGNTIQLDDLQGCETLLLFWDPNCGYCKKMLSDLRDWETRSSREGRRLLIISTRDVKANRALELSSQILLDENFTAGRAFGISGTPMALLIDAEGKIASNVAAGAAAFWKLVEIPVRFPASDPSSR